MFSFVVNILLNVVINIKKGKFEIIKENWSFFVFKNSSKGKKEICFMEYVLLWLKKLNIEFFM